MTKDGRSPRKQFFDFISIKVITLSSPLKKMYAVEHNLDYEKLLDSSDYKEIIL